MTLPITTETQLVCWIVTGSVWFISFVLGTYCVFVLNKEKDAVYFVKRHYKIIRWHVGLTYFATIYGFFLYIYETIDAEFWESINYSLEIYYLTIWIFEVIKFIVEFSVYKIVAVRLWLYYYDLQVNIFNRNKEWRVIIDPKNEKSINNWFIRNQNKYYYNTKGFIIIIVVVSIIESIICSILFEVLSTLTGSNMWSSMATAIIYLLDFSIINGYLIFFKIMKTERFGNDNLGFKNEFICIFVIAAIYWVIFTSITTQTNLNDPKEYIGIACGWIITIIYPCCLTVIFVLFPRYHHFRNCNINSNSDNSKSKLKLKSIFKKKKYTKKNLKYHNMSNSDSDYEMALLGDNNNINNYSKISWTKLVSFYDGFEAIMNHLEKEFAMENLLLVQEVIIII